MRSGDSAGKRVGWDRPSRLGGSGILIADSIALLGDHAGGIDAPNGFAVGYFPRAVRSSCAILSGSARKSISTIFRFLMVTAAIENGSPWRKVTIPAAPLISARRMVRSTRDHRSAWLATVSAPRRCWDRPVRPPSALRTTSGSSTATSASKSPSRAAALNASTPPTELSGQHLGPDRQRGHG